MPWCRLLFRVDPLPRESPRGYLCRVAHAHRYGGPLSLAQIAGLSACDLEWEESVKQISHVLRLEPDEWRAMCYRHIKGRDRFDQRMFCGERVSADDLNYGRPRLCPACLREHPIWWAVWDLGLVTACPIHRCFLLHECPACKRKLAWQRPAVNECRCGLDFRDLALEPADSDLVAINAAIYRAAGFPPGAVAELELTNYGFPREMLEMRLGPLLRFILFIGSSLREGNRLRRKQRPFSATELAAATEIGRAAVALLRDWPSPLREVLRRMIPVEADESAVLNFKAIFGDFYRHLFCVLPRSEFGFFHDAFERFVVEDWKGLIRGQHRYFSAATRRNSQWMPAEEAERTARTRAGRISALVRRGQIEGMFLSASRDGGRTECWIRRDSLMRWIAARDAGLARYMSRPEAKSALGLTNRTIASVAAAGVIRCVRGPEQNFPSGFFYFLREDVMKIKHAFEKPAVPVKEYSKPGELIALRHAMKNYLGRDSGLAVVIRAVVDGNLTLVGRTERFRGITGYLFLSEDLRKYRPVRGVQVPPEGFHNCREAAAVLGIKPRVIRGLVMQGILGAPAPYQPGLCKLVPAADIRRFSERYVAVTVLAKRLNLNGRLFARHLKESGVPLFEVPTPEGRRGPALFLPKEIAARLRPVCGLMPTTAQ
ncbi:MAG TPA: TniQ family protein [Terriglobales bacterium]|nr:TniQ family protein [Terriglobales bacterium]